MEALRVRANRMAQLAHVTTENEVERLDLPRVRLPFVERQERFQDGRTADGGATHGHALLEAQRLGK